MHDGAGNGRGHPIDDAFIIRCHSLPFSARRGEHEVVARTKGSEPEDTDDQKNREE